MPVPDGGEWLLEYADSRSNSRMLTSLPADMLADVQMLADIERISSAELTRRALTGYVAEYLERAPGQRQFFKGRCP